MSNDPLGNSNDSLVEVQQNIPSVTSLKSGRQKAARQADVFAEAALGALYAKGLGVKKNTGVFFERFSLSAKHNCFCGNFF